jgi:hypothetical protein
MKQSSLVKNIAALAAKDRKQFAKWLASPLFNQREDLLRLFQYIHHYIEKKPELLFKEQVWPVIYPQAPYQEAKMNLVMSLLLQQLRDFLAWRAWQEDQPVRQLYLCKALRRAGLDQEFERAWQDAQAALLESPYRDEQFYQLSHQLFNEKFDHLSLNNRVVEVPFEQMAEHRQVAYQLGQLRLQCSTAVFQNVSRQATSDTTEKPLEPDIQNPALPSEPGIRLYRCLLAAQRDPQNETAFFEAKALIHEHWHLFREAERREQYLIALNFCIRKINSGQSQFMAQAFELYQSGLENKALFENGILSQFTYKNATTAGIMAGQSAWVRQFLEDYKPFLHPRERHHAYVYNLAVYYFRLRDYEQAMTLLRDTNLGDDSLTNLDARSMLVRIYYERGYMEALESLLDSFGAYLRRRTDIGYHKANFENLIRFVRQMLRKFPLTAEVKARIRDEAMATQQLAERGWLMQQLA